jgi:hypothetical protein
MRTDGELNRHFDKLKSEKDKPLETLDDPPIMVYDGYTDEMISQVEYLRRCKARGII